MTKLTKAQSVVVSRALDQAFNAKVSRIEIKATEIIIHFQQEMKNMGDSASMRAALDCFYQLGLIGPSVNTMWFGIDADRHIIVWCVRGL